MDAEKELIRSLGVDASIERIETRHGVLHSIVAGSGDDVLLLHGVNIGWGAWHLNIAALAKYFKVHALDLPGAGNSTKIDPSSKEFGKILVSAVEEYIAKNKFSRVHLVGHSLGAWVALKLLIAGNPAIDKAVLVSPLGFTEDTPRGSRLLGSRTIARLLSKTAVRPTKKNIEKFLKGVFYDAKKLDPRLVDYYYEAVSHNGAEHPFLLMNRFAGPLKVRDEFNLIDMVRNINRPVLIIVGEDDPIVLFNERHKRAFFKIPNVRFEHFAKAGHVPSLEQAEAFNTVVIDFLKPRP